MYPKIYTLWHVYGNEAEFVASSDTLHGLTKTITRCILSSKSMRFGDISLHRPDQIRLVREMARNGATVDALNELLSYGEIEERDAFPGEEAHKQIALGPVAEKCLEAVRQAVEANKATLKSL